MHVIGYLREKSRLPNAEGEPPLQGFSVPIVPPKADPSGAPVPEPFLIRGADDARIVRGELSEDRAEVRYLSPWGLVCVPFGNFAWIIELPGKSDGLPELLGERLAKHSRSK